MAWKTIKRLLKYLTCLHRWKLIRKIEGEFQTTKIYECVRCSAEKREGGIWHNGKG
jgi:hypothetical protein